MAANKAKAADKVTVKLPRANNGEGNYITASVNGKVYKIKRGVSVEVPVAIAEVIANSEMAQDVAVEYIESRKN